jgi:dolichyl-diphosphooligosaccharide---protein glycosyltransferase
MMRRSLLYNLHGHKIKPGVEVSEDRFVEVYRSKYGKVRIYKISGVSEESKQWIAQNYECDAEGSWFCPGKYPPGLKAFLDTKKDFRQLEDFNRQDRDDEYQKKYFENLQNPESARRTALERERLQSKANDHTPPVPVVVDEQELARRKELMYNTWEDSDATTRMWQIIKDDRQKELIAWLVVEPEVAYLRSRDGRGPMFWAYEQRNEDITKILLKAGVPNSDRDAQGKTPVDLLD